jgi:small subunit ribosomal protein S9
VFLRPGTGKLTVNNKAFEQYFFDETHRMLVKQPLQASETLEKFDLVINVRGGGMRGQAGAVQHGIARALLAFNADLRQVLKKAGFLTRDPRMKERKKYGQPGARKRFQFSKR